MKGYKAFRKDLTCKGFQYEIGGVYEMDGDIKICERGFHFCSSIAGVYEYYPMSEDTRVCEVEVLGEIATNDAMKFCTNKIKIVREITEDWERKGNMCPTSIGYCNNGSCNRGNRNLGNYNEGHSNKGDGNSGNHNGGDYNSGNCNRGHKNEGDCNCGHCNSGNRNRGDFNSGNRNNGDYNSGSYNNGCCNTGDYNRGDYNSGDWNNGDYNNGDYNRGFYNNGDYNSGDWNCGNYNNGDWNCGHCNNGDYNGGDYNKGNCNSGDCNNGRWNCGDSNVGDFNVGDCNSGCFNTDSSKIRMFNKDSDWTHREWRCSHARVVLMNLFSFVPEWLAENRAADDGGAEWKGAGERLRTQALRESIQKRWDSLSEGDKNAVLSLPNFDAKIFKECTGIDVG